MLALSDTLPLFDFWCPFLLSHSINIRFDAKNMVISLRYLSIQTLWPCWEQRRGKALMYCHNNCNGGQMQRQAKINCVFESDLSWPWWSIKVSAVWWHGVTGGWLSDWRIDDRSAVVAVLASHCLIILSATITHTNTKHSLCPAVNFVTLSSCMFFCPTTFAPHEWQVLL